MVRPTQKSQGFHSALPGFCRRSHRKPLEGNSGASLTCRQNCHVITGGGWPARSGFGGENNRHNPHDSCPDRPIDRAGRGGTETGPSPLPWSESARAPVREFGCETPSEAALAGRVAFARIRLASGMSVCSLDSRGRNTPHGRGVTSSLANRADEDAGLILPTAPKMGDGLRPSDPWKEAR